LRPGDPDPLEILEGYASGRLRVPWDPLERGRLEARLGLLRGHLARLAGLPRGSQLRVERAGVYAVALTRGAAGCLQRLLQGLREAGWRGAPAAAGCPGGLQGLVAGVDWDTGRLFLHPLPPAQAAVLAASEALSEALVRAAMGFHLHRWEPGAGEPVEGLRVRLQGDAAVEYAALLPGRREALEAAEALEAFQRGLQAGVEAAMEAAETVAEALEAAGSLNPRRLLEALEEWLASPQAPPEELEARVAVQPPQPPAPARVRVSLALPHGGEKGGCRLQGWRRLRGDPRCALEALKAAGLGGLAVPARPGGAPAAVELGGDALAALAAAYAAAAARLPAPRLEPRRLAVEVGGHVLVAEEAVAVYSPGAALLHSAGRAARLLAEAFEALAGGPGRGEPLPAEAAGPLLEMLSLDAASHVVVLVRPQRIVVEHGEHGRARLDVEAPAAIIPGGLKTVRVAVGRG